jgi:hypothetical protein
MRQLRIEELGDTWLRWRNPTKGLVLNDDDDDFEFALLGYITSYLDLKKRQSSTSFTTLRIDDVFIKTDLCYCTGRKVSTRPHS